MRGIIFSAPMVRALLAGKKTQTRRIIKLPKERDSWEPSTIGGDGCFDSKGNPVPEQVCIWNTTTGTIIAPPYGAKGDRLWVRERISRSSSFGDQDTAVYDADGSLVPYLDRWPWKGKTLSPIFLPWGCRRMELAVDDIRPERLSAISESDAKAEGVSPPYTDWTFRDAFAAGWRELHSPESWDLNPWVWVRTFRVEPRRE